jgi:serine/threonine protein kinase
MARAQVRFRPDVTCTSCGRPLEVGATACPSCGTAVKAPLSGPGTSVSHRNLRPVRDEKTVNPVRTQDVLAGRYRLLDKIGEGGMGTVFIAHDQELDRQVAVKLLAASLVHDPEVVERFEREARLTAKLDHPNIVPIYDVGRHEDRPFIVMKLLQGDSLAGVLRQKGGLTSDETLKLLRQLAAGLDYIHGQGFIHRDVKSGNIFVAPDGLATILDFGILRPKSAVQGLTRTGMVMGTPHYMAPEQALGLKDVDHRVDIYALAVVLFECLTGTLPFEADSELRLIQLQAHAPPPDIIDRAPWISRPVAAVMRRALAKRPEDRFNTGADLVAALDAAYLESKVDAVAKPAPASAPPPAISTATAPSLRRLGQTPPPVVAGVPLTSAAKPPDTKALTQALRPRRLRALLAVGLVAGLGAVAYWYAQEQPTLFPEPTFDAGLAIDAGRDEQDDAGTAVALAVSELLDAGEPDDDDAGVDEPEDAGKPGLRPTYVKKVGRVNVVTTSGGEAYWAQVAVDGVPRGRTPLLLELPTGLHVVRVERPGFRVQSREIRVIPGRVVVRFELTP